jgi:hypothetical protein
MKGPSPAQDGVAQRRQSAAQQRYVQAIRALATIPKLLRPALSTLDLLSRPVAEEPAEMAGGVRSRLKIKSDAVFN